MHHCICTLDIGLIVMWVSIGLGFGMLIGNVTKR